MLEYKDIISDYKKNSNFKYCFYHDKSNCDVKIRKAHSIQKEKILTQIEESIKGNKLLYSFDSFSAENHKVTDIIPIGKKKASIFTGFCNYHDSKLFSPIENFSITLTSQQLFLLTYRTFAHSFHQLIETHKYYYSKSEFIKTFPKEYLNYHRILAKRNIEDALPYKNILDTVIKSEKFSAINYYTYIVKPYIPIACSSILSPLYSHSGIYLNPQKTKSYLALNVIPDNNRTIIVLSHFAPDKKGKILFNELKQLKKKDFTEAISSLIIYCTTNTFLSPSVWNKFSIENKQQLFKEFDFCTMHGEKIKNFFKSKINFFQKKYSPQHLSI